MLVTVHPSIVPCVHRGTEHLVTTHIVHLVTGGHLVYNVVAHFTMLVMWYDGRVVRWTRPKYDGTMDGWYDGTMVRWTGGTAAHEGMRRGTAVGDSK